MTGAERLEMVARYSAAYALIIALFFLNISAAPAPLSFLVQTPFTVMALYYWCVHRPLMMPLWLVFTLGILLDIFSFAPLGLNALIFVLARLLLVHQRRFLMAQGFMIFWFGYIVVNIIVHALMYSGVSLLNWQLLPFESLFMPVFLGTMFFPLVCGLLRLSHKLV